VGVDDDKVWLVTAYFPTLDVGERLEQIVDALRDTLTEIAVVQYSDKAA